MAENQTDYQYLVDHVPEDQKESLKKRIKWALDRGWKYIGLWTDGEPTEIDLVGTENGIFKFVPLDID